MECKTVNMEEDEEWLRRGVSNDEDERVVVI